MRKTTTLIFLAGLTIAPAGAAPFAKGNAEAGAELHAAQCDGCHANRFGGDGGKIYTRKDRRANNPGQLAQWLTTCNANLGNNLFPEDELDLGAYLNQRFYKFK